MGNEALATYLNDHLAGSVIALELLARMEKGEAGALSGELRALREEIAGDRVTLETLMQRLQIGVSKQRQLTAWVTEKVGVLKMRLDDPGHGAFARLESLEMVSLGILGKQALWRALAAVAATIPELGDLDDAGLLRRAAAQHDRVEQLRVQAARDAFGASHDDSVHT